MLHQRSRTEEPAIDNRSDQLEEAEDGTTQKATEVHSNIETKDNIHRRPSLSTGTMRSLTTQRRHHFVRDDGTPTVTPYLQSVPLPAYSTPLPCNADNPLRALLRFSTAARDFCPSYLAVVHQNHPSSPLPTYISQYDSADVASACSCFELTVACCTTTTSTTQQSADAPGTTATHAEPRPSPQSQQQSPSSRTSQSLSSSPDPATEDSTFSRPQESYGAPPTSLATITATIQGPTSVPDPSTSLYSPTHVYSHPV